MSVVVKAGEICNIHVYTAYLLRRCHVLPTAILVSTKKLVGIHLKNEEKHKLTLFFQMSTTISPSYLSSLVPQSVDHVSIYNLRNSHNPRPVAARTKFYYNSFLPSVIRNWNELPAVVRQLHVDSVSFFKNYINGDFAPVPKYSLTGNLTHTFMILL